MHHIIASLSGADVHDKAQIKIRSQHVGLCTTLTL